MVSRMAATNAKAVRSARVRAMEPVRDATFTISQLAREFGVTARALRFYEDKGLLSPHRENQARHYSMRDRARLQVVLRGKRVGLSLQEIKQLLDLYDLHDGQRAQMRAALGAFRLRVEALRAQRADIEHAIEELDRGIAWIEARLASPEPGPYDAATMQAFAEEARRRMDEA